MKTQPNILITGASGFVGHHLVAQGLDQGYRVFALVRKSSNITGLEGASLLYGDVTDPESLMRLFAELKADGIKLQAIIHAAALTKSNVPGEIRHVNVGGTINLYSTLEKLDYIPERIVFISSLAACGPTGLHAEIGKTQATPLTTYGKSKLDAERYVQQQNHFSSIILRPTAVYGPGEKDLYTIFKLIKQGFNPLLGSHPQRLTFIYVKDLVHLVYRALEKGRVSNPYFATDGQVYTKYDLPNTIARSLAKKPINLRIPLPLIKAAAWFSQHSTVRRSKTSPLTLEKYRELVAESWACNMEETYRELDYLPEYSLQKGVSETSAWYQQQHWI